VIRMKTRVLQQQCNNTTRTTQHGKDGRGNTTGTNVSKTSTNVNATDISTMGSSMTGMAM
jgi:hypothetical protein